MQITETRIMVAFSGPSEHNRSTSFPILQRDWLKLELFRSKCLVQEYKGYYFGTFYGLF